MNILSQIEKRFRIFSKNYKNSNELLSNILIIVICSFITIYDKVPNQLFIYFALLISIFIFSILFIKNYLVLPATTISVCLSIFICVIKLFIKTVTFDLNNLAFVGSIQDFIKFYSEFSIIFLLDFILLLIYSGILLKGEKMTAFIKSLVAHLLLILIFLFIAFSPKDLLPYISYMIFILIIAEYSVKVISNTTLFWPIIIFSAIAFISGLIPPINYFLNIKSITDYITFFKTIALSSLLNSVISISIFINLIHIYKSQKKTGTKIKSKQ